MLPTNPTAVHLDLQALTPCPARALLVLTDGTMYLGRHYQVLRSRDIGRTWETVAVVPRSSGRRLAELCRPAARLLRHEIRTLAVLADGTHVSATRSGVYFAPPGQTLMSAAQLPPNAAPCYPPMTIAVGPQDCVLWGEYNSRTGHGLPIRVFASTDRGRSFHVAHTFPPGDVLHIHSLMYDAPRGHYWVFAGDHGVEPGIGMLSADLRSFDWLARGRQTLRAVSAFDLGTHLVYATDSELEPNAVVSLDKSTGRIERLAELEGSGIYACRFGSYYALSTTVEPSTVNRSRQATLWLSRDAWSWTPVLAADKDSWPTRYFQYGSLVLPRGAGSANVLLFSGQAVRGYDGRAFIAELKDAG